MLPSVDEYEPEIVGRQHPSQQRKREYRQRHSIESKEPLLSYQRDENFRRTPIEKHIYANVEPPIKKNVRFSQRSQSLDYLETTFPLDYSNEMRNVSQSRKPAANSNDKKQRVKNRARPTSKDWSSSGEELCTDEFMIVYDNSSHIDPVNQKKRQDQVPLAKTQTSANSLNLVIDPNSNKVQVVFKDKPAVPQKPCRRKGAKMIHAPSCDGYSCQRVYQNETSL